MHFRDRAHAGQLLADQLTRYAGERHVLVLALPSGGVPVAYEVARRLSAPLDVFIVRKLGTPTPPERAFGVLAVGSETGQPVCVLNQDVLPMCRLTAEQLNAVVRQETAELNRRQQAYRTGRSARTITGKTVLLIDDGLATGATMRLAALALRQQRPARLVVAVPVACQEACAEFEREVDDTVCLLTPSPFYGVGQWYENFTQTTDEQVRQLLNQVP